MFCEDINMDMCTTNCLCENIECSFQREDLDICKSNSLCASIQCAIQMKEKTCDDVTDGQKEICPEIVKFCNNNKSA